MNFADREELAERKRRRKRRRTGDMIWNFLTICVLLAAFLMAVAMLLIYSNPFIAINPFPPPTLPALVMLPTSTATQMMLPPTWTVTSPATNTSEPIYVTATPQPTLPNTPEPTWTVDPRTYTESPYAFQLQGSVAELRSVVFKPETGCEWQGVAGQVVDLQGKPLQQITVELTGIYDGRTINMKTITGTHTEYGESGYEFQLGTTLVGTRGALTVQLTDQSFLPLSDKVVFNTYTTCDKNLVIINFKQVR